MSFIWPTMLLSLLLLPLFLWLYIRQQGRRRRLMAAYGSLGLVQGPGGIRLGWQRHLPAAFFLLGLLLLLVALARPETVVRLPIALFLLALVGLVIALSRPVTIVSVPAGRATIILAMDISRSMCATDIPPNRLQAAQAAALSFVQSQQSSTQIGIVAFAGHAELIQAPTTDQEVLADVVESLITGRRTAIGSAILRSLDAIAEIDEHVAPISTGPAPGLAPTPAPTGAYAPSIIVLLTDGASNRGPLPLAAAQQAVDRGVRVYTIGFGTERGQQGSLPFCGQQPQSGGDIFGGQGFGGQGFGGGGRRFRRGIDEETLLQIADMTGGVYYVAESADELLDVFQSLPTYLITKHETTEISVVFAAIGTVLAALAILLSMLWRPLG